MSLRHTGKSWSKRLGQRAPRNPERNAVSCALLSPQNHREGARCSPLQRWRALHLHRQRLPPSPNHIPRSPSNQQAWSPHHLPPRLCDSPVHVGLHPHTQQRTPSQPLLLCTHPMSIQDQTRITAWPLTASPPEARASESSSTVWPANPPCHPASRHPGLQDRFMLFPDASCCSPPMGHLAPLPSLPFLGWSRVSTGGAQ